ncbi:MAG TPA: prolyl oligopeptidase family serine peptidase, partial [Dongiaceae bacterium]|nr:prolyl oligopeptidase family serine peptidase [Dongiaceae bacterium]
EREDATLGPTSFLAQISPAPDKTGFAAIRETVGVPSEITYRRGRETPWQALTDFNQAVAAELRSHPEVRPIAWTGADGLAIEGLLLLPRERGSTPLPMVVDVHGGPTWSVKHAFNPGFALPLAAAGFAVFLPNYRGNVGWGQAYAKLNVGDPGGAEFEDILRGIDWCVAAGIADPDRLGITGASYGGYLTAWAVATTRRFKAAVMVSGIANQWSCHYSCNHAFGDYIVGGPMAEEAPRRLAIERSPLMRLAGATTPTLILHGREDRCTPLGQAQELYSALVEQGAAAELVVYPREGHGLQERAHRRDAWRRTVGWFNRYLRPGA